MIAVTGTSGFIGKHLVKKLVSVYGKNSVLAITSTPINDCAYLLHNNYQFESNFFENAGYTNVTTVIHAGAFTPKNAQQANQISSCNLNISNTSALLNHIPKSVNNVIYLSTLDVYAPGDEAINESSSINPISIYGASKWYCEKLVSYWAEANVSLFKILRIGHTYGPGEEAYQKIIPQTMKQLLNHESPAIWGTGNELRSFIYIDDVVNAIVNAVAIEESITDVNIAGNTAISINNLVKLIVEVSQKNVDIKYIASSTKPRDILFDTSLMASLLGEEQTSLREGLINEWNYLNTTNS